MPPGPAQAPPAGRDAAAGPGQRSYGFRANGGYTGAGSGGGQTTMALPTGDPLETSGSLTGHILAQARPDAPATRSNTAKVLVVGLLLLGVLVLVGLLAATVTSDAIADLFGDFAKS